MHIPRLNNIQHVSIPNLDTLALYTIAIFTFDSTSQKGENTQESQAFGMKTKGSSVLKVNLFKISFSFSGLILAFFGFLLKYVNIH